MNMHPNTAILINESSLHMSCQERKKKSNRGRVCGSLGRVDGWMGGWVWWSPSLISVGKRYLHH